MCTCVCVHMCVCACVCVYACVCASVRCQSHITCAVEFLHKSVALSKSSVCFCVCAFGCVRESMRICACTRVRVFATRYIKSL